MDKAYKVVEKDVLYKFLDYINRLFTPINEYSYNWVIRSFLDEGGVIVYLNSEDGCRDFSWSRVDSYENEFSKDFPKLIRVGLHGGRLIFDDGNGVITNSEADKVNDILPDYYKQNGKDLFDHFTEMFPEEGFRGFMIGNIFKYVTRYPAKNGVEDLRKAQTYLNRLIEFEEAKHNDSTTR